MSEHTAAAAAAVVDPSAVAVWLGMVPGSETDPNLVMACDMAGDLIGSVPWIKAAAAADPDGAWPAAVDNAGIMLAARLYRRRNTPSGVESFGDNPATYVLRNDPDVARALRIGPYAMPAVG